MTVTILIALIVTASAAASSWPMPKHWQPSAAWMRQALCVHRHESGDWHRAGRDWQGNRSPYYGGMQFLVSTWRRAGGSGLPSDWSPREQLYRAWVIWRSHGGSWSEWGTAGACGLR